MVTRLVALWGVATKLPGGGVQTKSKLSYELFELFVTEYGGHRQHMTDNRQLTMPEMRHKLPLVSSSSYIL